MLDPTGLAVLQSALSGIAEEMGAVLVRAAYSPNIKERKDCSAALFDAAGAEVAQAEHIPVHLGALADAVAAVAHKGSGPGDVFALNDPFTGGSHLPDITMVSSLCHEGTRIGFAATRAHHADVGGMRPGSMPATSTEIHQEGLIIPPVCLVRGGELCSDVVDLILANSRTPEQRGGDLHAQLAANRLASQRLEELIDRHGIAVVEAALGEVVDYAERRAREALSELPDGTYRAETVIEGDGRDDRDVPIATAVTVLGEELTVDFAGTAPQVEGNVNCPLAVTRAACIFALRVLLPPDVPRNAGPERLLTVRAPEGSVVNARKPAAVVAGNVETSQRVADVVLAALRRAAPLPAEGQGTMNNLVMGGSGWTYYETLGGGQGASPTGPGASGVHVGMTNTLNTPIEALELEYPLRVECYELLDGSGGAGRHRGGDGLVRRIVTLDSASLSLLTDRRRHRPQGAAGGGPGDLGANLVNGRELPAKAGVDLTPGDVVEIRTPGGGGWGRPP